MSLPEVFSFQCSLGVEFLNPNVVSKMAQFMISNQQKYVPSLQTEEETVVLKTVPFHRDQLFEERARNTQWVYQDGDNIYDRLEGLETEFADWHAKFNLYMVESDIFVNHSSAAKIGTSRASMNRTFKTNAAKGVNNHYNEYKEFHQWEIEAHVCAFFMEMSGMITFDGKHKLISPFYGHIIVWFYYFSFHIHNFLYFLILTQGLC